MSRLWGGAVLVVAGIAGFIEAGSHKPSRAVRVIEGAVEAGQGSRIIAAHGLSQTAYDMLRTGSWALVIVGIITLVTGLMAAARHPTLRVSGWWIGGGVVLAVAAFVAFTEAHDNRPYPEGFFEAGVLGAPSRLSQTGYDLVQIGGWALLVAGVGLIAVWLIGYWRRAAPLRQPTP